MSNARYVSMVWLQNAERVPSENSQGHSLKQEIALALIVKSHDQSATQIFKKLDHQFFHGTGRLDRFWLDDEASVQHNALGSFPNFSCVGDGPIGYRGSCLAQRCKGVDACSVPDETAAT